MLLRALLACSAVCFAACASSSPVVGPEVEGETPRDYPTTLDRIGASIRTHAATIVSERSLDEAREGELHHHAHMAAELAAARAVLEEMRQYCHLHTPGLALDLRIASDALRSMQAACDAHARSAKTAPSVDALLAEESRHAEAMRTPLGDAERLARGWRAGGDTHHCWKNGL